MQHDGSSLEDLFAHFIKEQCEKDAIEFEYVGQSGSKVFIIDGKGYSMVKAANLVFPGDSRNHGFNYVLDRIKKL